MLDRCPIKKAAHMAPPFNLLIFRRSGERRDPYSAASLMAPWLTAAATTKAGGYGSRLARSLSSSRPKAGPVGLAGTTAQLCCFGSGLFLRGTRIEALGIDITVDEFDHA